MTRDDLTEKLLDIKREHGWTWAHICEVIGGLSPMLITAACLGDMRLPKAQCARARELFGLTEAEERLLHEPPLRGRNSPMPPTDPLIYRFYELVLVYGATWKELIQEEFGDGIMSAIDFDMTLERLPDPKGDRVKIGMNGKFLPYRYYGAQQGTPELGFRED
ncbi:MAG: cyanase [Caulobacteraceae bacterium]